MSTQNEVWAAELRLSLFKARETLGFMLEDDEQHSPIILNTDRATEVRLFHLLNEMLADGAYDSEPFEEYAVMIGNPGDGFTLYGPFLDSEAAQEWCEKTRDDNEWWIIRLWPAAEKIEPAEPRDAATATGMYDREDG